MLDWHLHPCSVRLFCVLLIQWNIVWYRGWSSNLSKLIKILRRRVMTRSFIFCIRSNMTSAQSSSFFRMNYQLLKSKCYICVYNSSKLFWSRHRHRWRHVCELRLFTKQSVWIGYVRMRKWWMHPKSTAVQFRERLWRRIRWNRLPHLPVSIVGSFLSLDAMLTSLISWTFWSEVILQA